MLLSTAGHKLIQGFEALRLTAYLDTRGIWTLGWGHINGVKKGDTCSALQADEWFGNDVITAATAVNSNIKILMTQNQFDAMVSLAYNIGAHGFANSDVVKHFNLGDVNGAANAFLNWHRPNLLGRRLKEKAFFLEAT